MTNHCASCGQSLSLERASFLRTLTAAAAWRERSLLAKLGVPGVEALTGEQVRDLCVAHFEAARVRYEPVMLDTNDGRWLDSHFGNVAFALEPATEKPTLADAGASVVSCLPPSQLDVAEQHTASVGVVPRCTRCGGKRCPGDCDGYSEADLRAASEHLRAALIDRVELAQAFATVRAEATAAERERAAGKCDALEAEFEAAYKALDSRCERDTVLRAQADGCAQCAFVIRDGGE